MSDQGKQSVLPKARTATLLARIKKLVTMWTEEEQMNGNNIFYWNIMGNAKMANVAKRAPTTLAELAACELPENIRQKYGERLVRSIKSFMKHKDQADEKIIILKIGGSSITNKAQEETLNEEALDWFANLVSESVDPSFLSADSHVVGKEDPNASKSKAKFIVVHGAGSFGHHSAKRYGLRCGKAAFLEESDHQLHPENSAKRQKLDPAVNGKMKQRYQMEGLSKTRQSVQKLNAATVNCLIKHGVNAVGISPGMSIPGLRAHGATGLPKGKAPYDYMDDGSPRGMQDLCTSIEQTLGAGLVPVVHGDACLLYDPNRAGILGGDTLAEGLATLWNQGEKSKIYQVIFITDVAGVFSSDPKSDRDAELIRSLKVNKDTGELIIESKYSGGNEAGQGKVGSLNLSGSSHAHDVTGGLKAKLGAAVTIVQAGIDVIISQCGSESTKTFVKGDWDSVWGVEAGTVLSQQIT